MRSLIFAAFFLASSCLRAQVITTIAGTGAASYSGDGGAATAATLNHPHSLSIDTAGNIFVADQGNNAIRKITPAGIITTVAGTGIAGYSGDGMPATSAMINRPFAVLCDPAGNIYISDYSNSRIRKVSAAGIITTFAGDGSYGSSGDGGMATDAVLMSPCGLTIDTAGNIYWGEEYAQIIRKVNPAGVISTFAGTISSFGYGGDGGPATDASFSFPNYVHADNAGNLYVSDNSNHVIRKIDSLGVISTFAGDGTSAFSGDGGPATNGKIGFPAGICSDGLGNIYISDSYNDRVRKINTLGILSTVAGNGSLAWSGDGGAALAAGMEPNDIVFDAAGSLYIADYSNNRIRKIQGPLTTTAINVIEKSTFRIYPNPANDVINVEADNAYRSFTITNDIGIIIREGSLLTKTTQINLQFITQGLYFISLKGDTDTEVQKFIKW